MGIRARHRSTRKYEVPPQCRCVPLGSVEPASTYERRDDEPAPVVPPLTGRQRLIAYDVAAVILALVVIATRSTELIVLAAGALYGLLTWLTSGKTVTVQS